MPDWLTIPNVSLALGMAYMILGNHRTSRNLAREDKKRTDAEKDKHDDLIRADERRKLDAEQRDRIFDEMMRLVKPDDGPCIRTLGQEANATALRAEGIARTTSSEVTLIKDRLGKVEDGIGAMQKHQGEMHKANIERNTVTAGLIEDLTKCVKGLKVKSV